MSIVRFTLSFLLFALAVFGSAQAFHYWFPQTVVLSPHFNLLVLFLFFLTLIAFALSYIGIRKSAELGVFALLGGSILKMIFALAFIFLLFRKSAENQFVLVVNFFSVYFLFTIFEVIVLLRILRDQNKT